MPGQSLWVTLLFLLKALLAMPIGSAVPNWGQNDVYSSGKSHGNPLEGFCVFSFHLTTRAMISSFPENHLRYA